MASKQSIAPLTPEERAESLAMWRRIYEYDAEITSQAAKEAADWYQEKLRKEQQSN